MQKDFWNIIDLLKDINYNLSSGDTILGSF
jgi:hypothetical protein